MHARIPMNIHFNADLDQSLHLFEASWFLRLAGGWVVLPLDPFGSQFVKGCIFPFLTIIFGSPRTPPSVPHEWISLPQRKPTGTNDSPSFCLIKTEGIHCWAFPHLSLVTHRIFEQDSEGGLGPLVDPGGGCPEWRGVSAPFAPYPGCFSLKHGFWEVLDVGLFLRPTILFLTRDGHR